MTERADDSAAGRRTPPAAAESGHPATDLVAASRKLLDGGPRQLDAAALREALADLNELWLSAKAAEIGVTATSGFAIVATGGLGRRELIPYSDLDLMLVHDNMPEKLVTHVAELLWYPLWDANIRLDHSVRTVPEALAVADTDLSAGLAMLEARHICGDARLSSSLIGGARRQWRAGISRRFDELTAQARARWQRSGQIAHRAEPDLKSGMGGLRDVQLLNALSIAQLADVYPGAALDSTTGSLASAHLQLLNIRTELHRVSGRGRDQMLAQYADETGAALGIGDRFDLARILSDAARTVSYYVDAGLRTAANALPRRGLSVLRRPVRRPLDEGVVEFAGEVILARDARPQRDAGLTLRVAAASATTGIPIAASTLGRLAETAPELRTPWPRDALDDLLVLLSAGPTAVTTIEALDRTGLWGRIFPEWGAVRDLPPRDPIHIWTVDRHLVETVSRASAFTTRVSRPDLLVLGALLHDIGKGRSEDHSVIGAELATRVGSRLGLWPSDVRLLSAMVRHHLLLPSTATHRDLADPATAACERCRFATYCGPACQTAHWPSHKPVCVAITADAALMAVAVAPNYPPRPLKCHSCAVPFTTGCNLCEVCFYGAYCSRACSVAHWPTHYVVCASVTAAKKARRRSSCCSGVGGAMAACSARAPGGASAGSSTAPGAYRLGQASGEGMACR
jgi:[protein-PII] uridylyltransferase